MFLMSHISYHLIYHIYLIKIINYTTNRSYSKLSSISFEYTHHTKGHRSGRNAELNEKQLHFFTSRNMRSLICFGSGSFIFSILILI